MIQSLATFKRHLKCHICKADFVGPTQTLPEDKDLDFLGNSISSADTHGTGPENENLINPFINLPDKIET